MRVASRLPKNPFAVKLHHFLDLFLFILCFRLKFISESSCIDLYVHKMTRPVNVKDVRKKIYEDACVQFLCLINVTMGSSIVRIFAKVVQTRLLFSTYQTAFGHRGVNGFV